MLCIHNWDNEEIEQDSLTRTCLKCGKEQIYHHLLHAGLEWHFYDDEKPRKTYEQLRKESKLISIIAIFGLISTFILLNIIGVFTIVFIFTLVVILYHYMWKNIISYAIPVKLEKTLEFKYRPYKSDTWSKARKNAEMRLMHSFALGQITEEEYTSRMARM